MLYASMWAAPPGAKLALEIRCDQPNTLVVGLDDAAADVALQGGAGWQAVALSPADLKNADGEPLAGWAGIRELRLGDSETLKAGKKGGADRRLGGPWKGAAPEFRNLRWTE